MSKLLKNEIKCLAAASKLTRQMERESFGAARKALHEQRVNHTRKLSWAAHIVYAYLRGQTWDKTQGCPKNSPQWVYVERYLEKYSILDMRIERQRFAAWLDGAMLLRWDLRPKPSDSELRKYWKGEHGEQSIPAG